MKKQTKRQMNIRASELLRKQLRELCKQLNLNITEVVSMAIDRMFQQEIKADEQKEE